MAQMMNFVIFDGKRKKREGERQSKEKGGLGKERGRREKRQV